MLGRCEEYEIDVPKELLRLIYDDLEVYVKHEWIRDDLVGYLKSKFKDFEDIYHRYSAKEF